MEAAKWSNNLEEPEEDLARAVALTKGGSSLYICPVFPGLQLTLAKGQLRHWEPLETCSLRFRCCSSYHALQHVRDHMVSVVRVR